MNTRAPFVAISRFVSPLLIASILVTTQVALENSAHAAFIGTEAFTAEQTRIEQRARIVSLLERDDVRLKLKELGVSPAEASARVASLSDAEIAQLNEKIDQLPAGADAAGTILGVALAVFLILLLTDILCLTKVFPFTRCAGSAR